MHKKSQIYVVRVPSVTPFWIDEADHFEVKEKLTKPNYDSREGDIVYAHCEGSEFAEIALVTDKGTVVVGFFGEYQPFFGEYGYCYNTLYDSMSGKDVYFAILRDFKFTRFQMYLANLYTIMLMKMIGKNANTKAKLETIKALTEESRFKLLSSLGAEYLYPRAVSAIDRLGYDGDETMTKLVKSKISLLDFMSHMKAF